MKFAFQYGLPSASSVSTQRADGHPEHLVPVQLVQGCETYAHPMQVYATSFLPGKSFRTCDSIVGVMPGSATKTAYLRNASGHPLPPILEQAERERDVKELKRTFFLTKDSGQWQVHTYTVRNCSRDVPLCVCVCALCFVVSCSTTVPITVSRTNVHDRYHRYAH